MSPDLSVFEDYKCMDKRTGKSIGIVLATGTFTDLDYSGNDENCLWTIDDGVCSMKTYVGNEIENVEISAEPLTMQDLIHNASVLFSRWHELEDVDHDESVVAYNQRNDFVRKIADLMNANGLATEFNLVFLKTCLTSFSIA